MIKYMDTMVIIDDKIVSSEIFTEYFACDYAVCGGACCIIGDSGAPMEEDEPERIEANYGRFSPLMSPEGRAVVEEKGFFEIDSDGDMVTPLVPGREECAYAACDEDGNWFCTIERSWCRGGSDFVKPISCRLYPIRVSRLSNGMIALNLHRWNICSCPPMEHLLLRLRQGQERRHPGLPLPAEASDGCLRRRFLRRPRSCVYPVIFPKAEKGAP